MKVTFSPDIGLPPKRILFLSWHHPDLIRAIREVCHKAYNKSGMELADMPRVDGIVIEEDGIKVVFGDEVEGSE